MDEGNEEKSGPKGYLEFTNHPWFNIAILAWGLSNAIFLATYRDDVYLIAKAGEIVALSLGRLLIQRQIRWFFGGLLATGLALPVAVYTTTPIFWGHYLRPLTEEFYEILVLGGLCALPILIIAIWGLRKTSPGDEPTRPDPGWFKWLSHLFKWTMAVMLLSFHIANPPLIILGILVFIGGMICLAAVRLNLTRRHVGNFLILVGGGVVVIALLLIPLGIAHVSPAEASLAVIPGAILMGLGFILRLSSNPVKPV